MPSTKNLVILVPECHTQTVRAILKIENKIDRSTKIVRTGRFCTIRTLIQAHTEEEQSRLSHQWRLKLCSVQKPGFARNETKSQEDDFEFVWTSNDSLLGKPTSKSARSPAIQDILRKWLNGIPRSTYISAETTPEELLQAFPTKYSIYPPLMLLPKGTFQQASWKRLQGQIDPQELQRLYSSILDAFKATHLAIEQGIPIDNLDESGPNILRHPLRLQPMHGDFGPLVAGVRRPTSDDFSAALWVQCKQNGIIQIWAPLYTMFSKGNVTEKARVLSFPNISRFQDSRSGAPVTASSVVDLYAGIGYFAFCYIRAGADKVVCWELNPWSVEGLRRGAAANKWGVKMAMSGQDEDVTEKAVNDEIDTRLIVYQEDNRHAADRIVGMRHQMSPIRHVNCGLLPSSEGVWESAVRILDPVKGGYIHVHENIALRQLDARVEEIIRIIETYAARHGDESYPFVVRCVHVEHVKSYSKGVDHCVLDIQIQHNLVTSGISST
ncbi:MAG: hypothetical protein M1825_000397 [Sarcosagium campestre]|nr:MAG: hypothetical protein M1825_000397 [Sarcosagium campestre]